MKHEVRSMKLETFSYFLLPVSYFLQGKPKPLIHTVFS
jgi:hypothetical protein